MMKKVFRLFVNEFLNIYKHAIIFIIIASFLFTLSINLWCFSLGIIEGYKKFIDDKNPEGIELNLDSYNIHDYKKLDALGVSVEAIMKGVTYYPTITFGGNTSGELNGTSLYFRDELISAYKQTRFIGRVWDESDNAKRDGVYSIFLSNSVAVEINANINDIIYLNCVGRQEKFRIVGIYLESDKIYDSFVIPFNYLYDLSGEDLEKPNLRIRLYCASDVLRICPALNKMGIRYESMYITLEEVNLINATKIILYALAIIAVILSFLVLNNMLTIIMHRRNKYIARLKMLGATSGTISVVYFIALILSFLVAFALSVLLGYLLCGYFSNLATMLMGFESVIILRWEAIISLLSVSLILISFFYLLFYKKMKRISPLSYIRSL